MKQILIIFLLIFPTLIFSQRYNPLDTTWILTHNEVSKIKLEIDYSRNVRKDLEKKIIILNKEINNLEHQRLTRELIIKKLVVRDSLYQLELDKAAEIEKIFREKILVSNEIINNYKVLLFSAEDQLKASEKKRKRENFWKNIYKYSYPVAIGVTTLLIFK